MITRKLTISYAFLTAMAKSIEANIPIPALSLKAHMRSKSYQRSVIYEIYAVTSMLILSNMAL